MQDKIRERELRLKQSKVRMHREGTCCDDRICCNDNI